MRRLLRKPCGVRSRYDTDGSRGVVLSSDVYVCMLVKSRQDFSLVFFFDATFARSRRGSFPSLWRLSQSQPSTVSGGRRNAMEINERRIGKGGGQVVEIGKIEASQTGLECPGA